MSRSLPMTAAWFLPLVICALDAPWPRETPAAVRKTFVNSTGIRMISVQGKRFDAWTPSAKQFYLPLKNGKRPTAAFALNRPRITAPVTLKDYWLSEFPVTNRLYRQFVKATGHREPGGRLVNFYWRPSNGGTWNREKFRADQVPVTGVNNTDIEAFCKWLSTRDGRRYRPPTIREFEFANRAGTSTRFWWGPQPDVRKMNFGLSMIGHPTPVGSYPPNPWGFYDMHGNVWQFCTDAGRYSAMGSAFNCPRRWTGIDAWGNFYEGPNTMSLLSTGFRVACDADQGTSRPGDLKTPAVAPAGGTGPQFPELEITVGKRIDMGTIPTNAAFFMVTGNGTWILNNKRSTDRGKTWHPCSQLGEAFCQLKDGTVISVPSVDSGGSVVRFADPLSGKSTLQVKTSSDNWKTVKTQTSSIHVPLAEFFWAVRGLVELDDGRLLLTMYGRLNGDRVREDSPVAYEMGNPWIKTRVIVVQSKDRGQNWQYLSTVSYNPQLGFEGQNESDLIRLSNGLLAVFMRTGIHGYIDPHDRRNLDQPLLVAWSADDGVNWSEPQRIHVGERVIPGIYPRALLTSQGVLAVLRCRPDGSIIFSPDGNGGFWSNEHVHYDLGDRVQHASMQDMALIGPDTILVTDIVRRDGWRVEGVPITVRKKPKTNREPR